MMEKKGDGGGGVAASEGNGSKEERGGPLAEGNRRKALTVGFAQSSPLVTTRSGTMIAGMGSALERERELERMLQRREKRGTLMLYQELSKGGDNQTLTLLQTAMPASPKGGGSSSASSNLLSPNSGGTKSPRGKSGGGKGDLSPRSKEKPEKSPRGSTIRRVLKLTQGITGDRSSSHSPEEKASPAHPVSPITPGGEKAVSDLNQPGLDAPTNPQWRHSVAFFSQMGSGFEKMLEEQRNSENKRWVNTANSSPRYRNPEDLERRYKKVAREEEETLELRRARDRVRAKLRAKLVDKLTKRAHEGPAEKVSNEDEEWEKADDEEDADNNERENEDDENDDDEESKDAVSLVTEDDAERELYSNLRRGMEQQQIHLSNSDSRVVPVVEIASPRSGSQEQAVWVKQMLDETTRESEESARDGSELPAGALVNRGRSGTVDFYHLMNRGARFLVPTPEAEENEETEKERSDNQERTESESEDENEKRWARRRWEDGSESRLELVRDVIRLKSVDKPVDNIRSVDVFGGRPLPALPADAVALILALSCASPKGVGYLHLVSPAWTHLLTREETGEAVWALWYKRHFGGGPFITSNPREYPLSWRATYQKEWTALKGRQRAESKTDDPAFNMLLHFIYRGHVVLVRELLSGHPNSVDLVNRVTSTTPLHAACQVGSLPIVRELVAHGAKTNVKVGPEAVRLTPFFMACMHGHQSIVQYFLERNKQDLEINANGGFASPVLIAAMNGHRAVLRTLLHHGGDPNQANANGELPLFVVLRRCGTVSPPLQPGRTVRDVSEGVIDRERKRRRNVAMLRQLLTYGANPATARTKAGEAPLTVAAQCGCGEDVVSLLRKHGATDVAPPAGGK